MPSSAKIDWGRHWVEECPFPGLLWCERDGLPDERKANSAETEPERPGSAFHVTLTLTAIEYPDARRLDYTLNRSGSVKAIPGIASDVVYDADGAGVEYTQANGVVVSMSRDPSTRLLASVSTRLVTNAVGAVTGIRDEGPDGVQPTIAMSSSTRIWKIETMKFS